MTKEWEKLADIDEASEITKIPAKIIREWIGLNLLANHWKNENPKVFISEVYDCQIGISVCDRNLWEDWTPHITKKEHARFNKIKGLYWNWP